MNYKELFSKSKLIPAVVQDKDTGEVLMLAYVNEQALELSIDTGTTWFYSRSRDRLWNKGETSGNNQHISQILVDCDEDTLIFKVTPAGPACHTGNRTCFYRMINEKGEIKDV